MSDKNCNCSILDLYAKDPRIPISYDEKYGEYRLMYGEENSGMLVLSYCFHCGGKLPETRRGDFFAEIDNEFVDHYKKILKDARSINEIIELLGEPDSVLEIPKPDKIDTEVYGIKDMRRQLEYSKLSDTTIVSVADYADGTFDYFFVPKEK